MLLLAGEMVKFVVLVCVHFEMCSSGFCVCLYIMCAWDACERVCFHFLFVRFVFNFIVALFRFAFKVVI